MRTMVVRTAYSAMIHEAHDFSCAVLTLAGELVAASEIGHTTHLSGLPWSRTILEHYPDDLPPGDLFLHNNPYTGGRHINDVALIQPVFVGSIPLRSWK